MPPSRAFACTLLLLAVAAHSTGSLIHAQDSASSTRPDERSCSGARPGRDSASADVFLALGPAAVTAHEWWGEKRVLPPAQHRRLESMLQTFGSRFPKSALVPAELTFPLDVSHLDWVRAASASVPSLRSRTEFTVRADGRIDDVRIKRSSRSPRLDTAIVNTLVALGADRTLAEFQGESRTQTAREPDSVRLALEMAYWPNAAVATALLATIRAPSFEHTPAVANPGNPQPSYPADLSNARVEGGVLVQFVIDDHGRVDMTTVRVVKTTHDAFTRSVIAVLPNLRFDVARINGCPARAWVQVPFGFRLRQ